VPFALFLMWFCRVVQRNEPLPSILNLLSPTLSAICRIRRGALDNNVWPEAGPRHFALICNAAFSSKPRMYLPNAALTLVYVYMKLAAACSVGYKTCPGAGGTAAIQITVSRWVEKEMSAQGTTGSPLYIVVEEVPRDATILYERITSVIHRTTRGMSQLVSFFVIH